MTERPAPSGVVTFMFTDIEGSTLLLQDLGEDYDALLFDHHRLLRAAWDAHAGYEVKTDGDAFFVAFGDPARALAAAAAAQRALAGHAWPHGITVRVRMGIHTGEARLYDGDYVGLAVHQAARIASAAHGGQVILSEAARVDGVAADVSFIDLGSHRLKDLATPVRLFQLAHPELDADFPAPRTLTVMPNNFPIQVTTFVGRDDDVAAIRDALATTRLLTLTGAGGVGKTRLALHVGAEMLEDFPDGAWLVDLASLSDPTLVAGAVASALGVREQPGRAIEDTLRDQLLAKRLLVVLDNCEHLIDACAKLVHVLLTSCPNVFVLATSRESLNVAGEVAWRLRSLDLDTEAIGLFVQRAASVRPGFAATPENTDAIAQICRRLDGLPLAIELAAARTRSMSVAEIAERLDDRFRLLTGGSRAALPRQRTLEATVSWSYDLLSEPERTLFDRLTVFAGGWTMTAAEQVCVDDELEVFDVPDLLARLVDRSIVVPEETDYGRTRYRLLETLRQFGRDRLIAGRSTVSIRDRHLAWAVALAESSPPQVGHLPSPEIAVEEPNITAALGWAFETQDYESGLRIVGAVWVGHFDDRRRWLKRLLPFATDVPADLLAKVTFAAGGLAFMTGDWQWGVETLRQAVTASTAVGDHIHTSMSLIYEGICTWGLGDMHKARDLAERGLRVAVETGVMEAEARAYVMLTWLETEFDIDRAEDVGRDGEAIAAKLATVFDLGHMREVQGFIRCVKGDYSGAATVLADAVRLFRDIQVNCASHMLETAAAWAVGAGRAELAAELQGAAERIRDETADKPRPWERAVREEWLPRIRQQLDEEVFEAAATRGRAMHAESALAHASQALSSY